MKVLILVLSARCHPWGRLMEAQMETWDSDNHPQTTTRYYVGRSYHEIEDNVWQSDLTECLEDVSSRTLEAFEKSLELEWDYMARVNSSCYVDKKNLVDFCEWLPKDNVLYGVMSDTQPKYLWGGCQYVISRDVIEKLVANKDKWNRHIMEDNSISFLADRLGVPLESKGRCASINLCPDGSYLCLTYNHGNSFVFTDWQDIKKAEGHCFFRVKHDPDRSIDVKVMRLLHEHFKC